MKFKQLSSLLLSIAMLVPSFSLTGLAFNDTKGNYAEGAINRWAGEGVVNGKSADIFDPSADVKRGEAAKIMVDLMNIDKEGDVSQFTDLDPAKNGAFPNKQIAIAYKAGILTGYADGKRMDPDGTLSRAQLFTVIGRALGIDQAPAANKSMIDDASIPDYAKGYVNALINLGVIKGMGDQPIVAPFNNSSRAQTMTVLDRLIGGYTNKDGGTVAIVPGKVTLIAANNVSVTGTASNDSLPLVVTRDNASVDMNAVSGEPSIIVRADGVKLENVPAGSKVKVSDVVSVPAEVNGETVTPNTEITVPEPEPQEPGPVEPDPEDPSTGDEEDPKKEETKPNTPSTGGGGSYNPGGQVSTPHNITITDYKYGTAKADKTEARNSEKVTITLVPSFGFAADKDSVTVIEKGSSSPVVTVTGPTEVVSSGNTATYTFTMPDSDVEVKVQFDAVEVENVRLVLDTDGGNIKLKTTQGEGETCFGGEDTCYGGENGGSGDSGEWISLNTVKGKLTELSLSSYSVNGDTFEIQPPNEYNKEDKSGTNYKFGGWYYIKDGETGKATSENSVKVDYDLNFSEIPVVKNEKGQYLIVLHAYWIPASAESSTDTNTCYGGENDSKGYTSGTDTDPTPEKQSSEQNKDKV